VCAARHPNRALSVGIYARAIDPKDITATVRFEGGRLTIPGSALESAQTKPGHSATLVYLA